MTTTLKTEVIIIGGGPTGLSLATQLLRYKIDFIILEKNEKTTHLSKAMVIQARTLEIFDEIDIAQKAMKTGRVTTAMNLYYRGKQKTFVDFADLGKGLSPFSFALSLEQSKTEKLLVDYLQENKRTICWKSEFTDFEQDDQKVTVSYNDHSGQEIKAEALYLVGCDGASSFVRHRMGLSFEGDTVPKIFYVADVRLSSSIINKSELFIFLIKKGFILFFPMEGKNHYRIIGILPEATDEKDIKFEELEPYIKNQVEVPLDFEELIWFSAYKVHSRKANIFENNRCFIAGDAAHIHTPAGGQGMNTGIQDAYNLAWKLAGVIRNETKPEVLKTYNTERSENAKHLLKTTDRLFNIMAGTNGFLNFLRLNVFPSFMSLITKSRFAKKKVFPLISQTAINYQNSILTVKSSVGKVKSGVRMPYFVFADGKQIFDFLKEPAFKILYFGEKNEVNDSLFKEIKIRPVVLQFREIPQRVFGNATGFYVLLRPDNHISYIGKDQRVCKSLLTSIST